MPSGAKPTQEVKMQAKIARVTDEALQGTRKIEVLLKEDAAPGDVKRLMSMFNRGMLWLTASCRAGLMHFQRYRQWKSQDDRAVAVTFTKVVDRDQFVREMCNAVEKIEVIA
ncbi:MAG: hypothetical protein A2563_01535 [Candidatus Magasanikbacteria bacterium RIFOXYD1_FULL_40_23]|uniref:Uncharacterized protein n=1 Tax=Candidatus Magasanikbacteria bacterium RIFOXYD1_FULL_40_23 TaxID=1798705 RepID=A0A1F6PAY0_9BACT|nr:MAG: hypothetical protein A2563_01535 [Candidatus Magasanikbacteria bacterium RIFOXYD1_FULL_40_23]